MHEYIEFFKAHPILSMAWVGLFIALLVTWFKGAVSKVKHVNPQEAVLMVNKQDAQMVDVRSKEDFRRGHIVNAVNIPMAEIKNNTNTHLEKLKDKPIILVCNAGMTSAQAGELLVKQGFEQVFSLKGGMGEWQSANLPVSKSKR